MPYKIKGKCIYNKETGKKKYYGFPLPVILIDDGISSLGHRRICLS